MKMDSNHRGLPSDKAQMKSSEGITYFNHLPAVELKQLMDESEFIISRSGYTTIMDIIALRKKSILIPTPGQSEQEYLGQYLMNKGICLRIFQNDFQLKKALTLANAFQYVNTEFNMDDYVSAIDSVLDRIPRK